MLGHMPGVGARAARLGRGERSLLLLKIRIAHIHGVCILATKQNMTKCHKELAILTQQALDLLLL